MLQSQGEVVSRFSSFKLHLLSVFCPCEGLLSEARVLRKDGDSDEGAVRLAGDDRGRRYVQPRVGPSHLCHKRGFRRSGGTGGLHPQR